MARLPSLSAGEILRALNRAGFFIHHTTGSHHILKHPTNPRVRITVPYHRGDLHRKTLATIIKQTGLTVEEFLKFL